MATAEDSRAGVEFADNADDTMAMMGERAASAAGLDVDWSTVDPAARASMEMALAMGANFDGPLARLAASEAAAASARCSRPEAPDLRCPGNGTTGRDGDASESGEGLGDSTDDAADDDEQGEEKGMGAPSGTAEASWGGGDDADWTLARIVRRRKYRGPVGSFDADVAAEDMRWEYLCAWEGHAEATWERRAWLQDYGFGDRVAAFDAERAPAAPSSTKKLRPTMPNRAELAKQQAKVCAAVSAFDDDSACDVYRKLNDLAGRVAKAAGRLDPQWYELMGTFFRNSASSTDSPFDVLVHSPSALHLFPSHKFDGVDVCDVVGLSSFLLTVLFAFSCDSQFCLEAVTPIAPRSLTAFAGYLRRTGATVRVVYVGTRTDAIASVAEHGLSAAPLPTTDPNTSNTSEFGAAAGVYSGTRLGTPHCYHNGNSDSIFACLAVADGPGVKTIPHEQDLHIVAEDYHIVPLLNMRVGCSFLNNGDSRARCAVFRDGLLQQFFFPRVYSR